MEEKKEERVDFYKLFEQERSEWKEKIQIISLNLKSIKTVGEAQVDLFTTRQTLLEYSFKLAQIVSKLNSKSRKENSRLLKEYSERSDVRYQANEKKTLIEGDLSDISEKIELVEGHRRFIDQTVQTVDHMLYGIRQRIALEEYMRGGTIK